MSRRIRQRMSRTFQDIQYTMAEAETMSKRGLARLRIKPPTSPGAGSTHTTDEAWTWVEEDQTSPVYPGAQFLSAQDAASSSAALPSPTQYPNAQVIAQKIWEDQHLFEEEPRPVPCADAEPAVATQVPPQDQRSPSRKGGHHSGQPSWASNTHPLGFDSESNEYAYVTALSPPPRRQNDPVRSRVVRHEDSKPVYSSSESAMLWRACDRGFES